MDIHKEEHHPRTLLSMAELDTRLPESFSVDKSLDYIDGEMENEEIYELKLRIAKLFIDALQCLDFWEFIAVSGALTVSYNFDESPKAPLCVNTLWKTFDPIPVSLAVVVKYMDTDKVKLATFVKSAFKKMPTLKTLFSKQFVLEVENTETPGFVDETPKLKDKLRLSGKILRSQVTWFKDILHTQRSLIE